VSAVSCAGSAAQFDARFVLRASRKCAEFKRLSGRGAPPCGSPGVGSASDSSGRPIVRRNGLSSIARRLRFFCRHLSPTSQRSGASAKRSARATLPRRARRKRPSPCPLPSEWERVFCLVASRAPCRTIALEDPRTGLRKWNGENRPSPFPLPSEWERVFLLGCVPCPGPALRSDPGSSCLAPLGLRKTKTLPRGPARCVAWGPSIRDPSEDACRRSRFALRLADEPPGLARLPGKLRSGLPRRPAR